MKATGCRKHQEAANLFGLTVFKDLMKFSVPSTLFYVLNPLQVSIGGYRVNTMLACRAVGCCYHWSLCVPLGFSLAADDLLLTSCMSARLMAC